MTVELGNHDDTYLWSAAPVVAMATGRSVAMPRNTLLIPQARQPICHLTTPSLLLLVSVIQKSVSLIFILSKSIDLPLFGAFLPYF